MSNQDRKAHLFLQREQKLLDLALDIMHNDGFVGLSMDKLTAKSDYSKGTIYNHFNCREDVLSAIGIQCLSTLQDLFSRALTFDGNSRERMLAVHFAYMLSARLKPDQFMCVLSCKTAAVTEKASQARQQLAMEKEQALFKLVDSLVIEACAQGDLDQAKLAELNHIGFCNWAMSFGSLALLLRAKASSIIKDLDVQKTFLYNMRITLDGLGWQPLSQNWDYEKTILRLQQTLFAEEWAALQ